MQGSPHPNPPSVPPPAPGTAAEKSRRMLARLWFAEGFWWFRCPHDGLVYEISSLMRELRYDARALARALGMSDRSLDRLVRDGLCQPVGTWLRSLRAVEFRFRVRTGEPIHKLAEDYDFQHPTDFSAEFKRWYQVTPRDYLKDFREANPGPEEKRSRKRRTH
jgi:AraC-like DNA-binding protein